MSLLHSITIPVGQGSTTYNISEPYIGVTEQNQYFAQFNTELNTVLLLNIYYSNRHYSILYNNGEWKQLISGSIPEVKLYYNISGNTCKVGLNLEGAYVQILGGIAIADADGTISDDDTSIALTSSIPTIYTGTEEPVDAFGLPGDLYIQITPQSATNQESGT